MESGEGLGTQRKEKTSKFPSIFTLKVPTATKVVCFSRLLKCQEASMANSVNPDQTAPIRAVCSGLHFFLVY